ncbi:MAG: Nif3-like dinuclear metal center hexameric protein [Clostridia bacterium]|nr:Nif3-like dinuclear metal center hexameric protein [Clostridia bacterium]
MQHPKKGIDQRLRAAADLVLRTLADKEAPLVADVGCDHGYLTAYLLRQRPDLSVIASDISGPSLAKARLLLDPGIYGSRVKFREADGLSALEDGEKPDCVVMAGMGGRLILDMLQKGRQKLGGALLVLQANTDVPLLRSGLSGMGLQIREEAYAEVKGRQYGIVLCEEGERRELSAEESLLGAQQEAGMSEGRRRYLTGLLAKRRQEQRLACVKRTPKSLEKTAEIAAEIEMISEELGMKDCTVSELRELVGRLAPYETAEEWDNVGLLVGRRMAPVRAALIALDLTPEVIREAKELGCAAIITHHPLMFHPVQRITDETREGELILQLAASGLSHIAAHTNLDRAPGGVNDTLIAAAGVHDVRGEGFIRVGDLEREMRFGELCERIRETLGAQIRTYGSPDKPVHVLGCCSGAGGSDYREAMELGADCFLTGEIRQHEALDAVFDGCPVIEAGHYETERPVCAALRDALQKEADALQYKVTFFCSGVDPFERG